MTQSISIRVVSSYICMSFVCMFVFMFVRLLTTTDWLKYTHNLSNTTKLILLDSVLQDDTAGAIIRIIFIFSDILQKCY